MIEHVIDVLPTPLVAPAITILGILNLHDLNHFLFKLIDFRKSSMFLVRFIKYNLWKRMD